MGHLLRSLTLGCFLTALLSCTDKVADVPSELQPGPGRRMLECELAQPVSMEGTALKMKVPRLWVDSGKTSVYRAYEFPDGRVVRNPYSLKSIDLTKSLQAELMERNLSPDWSSAHGFRFLGRRKAILLRETEGLLVTLDDDETLASAGGELASLQCKYIPDGSVEPHQELFPKDPPVPEPAPQPQEGCADGTTEQTFGKSIIGCSGTVSYANRNTLCGVGWRPCKAGEWVARSQAIAPTFNYWTDDPLKYAGNSSKSCEASLRANGSSCSPTSSPMRVCAAETDPLGNRCNWVGCGLDTTADQFFGGCNDNLTAGALCCR